MSDISINETCPCGATFRVTGSTYRSRAGGGESGQHRSAEEMAERWRTDHKHVEPTPTTTEACDIREALEAGWSIPPSGLAAAGAKWVTTDSEGRPYPSPGTGHWEFPDKDEGDLDEDSKTI